MSKIKIKVTKVNIEFLGYLRCLIVPFVVIGTFVLIFYRVLVDVPSVIKDTYFMHCFNSRMTWYSPFGYVLAGLCFGGYLYLAKKLSELNDEFKTQSKKVISSAAPQTIPLSTQLQTQYNELKSSFDFLFLISAAILSLFIIWEGILFIAINSMDIMKYYGAISGKQFLNNDFIYMIGLVHSLLLMIFYIPVQLRFRSMEIVQAQQAALGGQPTGIKSLFSSLFSNLGGVLITTSPLITGIIQSLLAH